MGWGGEGLEAILSLVSSFKSVYLSGLVSGEEKKTNERCLPGSFCLPTPAKGIMLFGRVLSLVDKVDTLSPTWLGRCGDRLQASLHLAAWDIEARPLP